MTRYRAMIKAWHEVEFEDNDDELRNQASEEFEIGRRVDVIDWEVTEIEEIKNDTKNQ